MDKEFLSIHLSRTVLLLVIDDADYRYDIYETLNASTLLACAHDEPFCMEKTKKAINIDTYVQTVMQTQEMHTKKDTPAHYHYRYITRTTYLFFVVDELVALQDRHKIWIRPETLSTLPLPSSLFGLFSNEYED